MATTYQRGAVEIADGIHAYLQPDGTWGWSNAGLVCGSGASTLVDTLFDRPLTQLMLDDLAPHTRRDPITALVNTHANGDHCYGNGLVAEAAEVAVDIVASEASAREFDEVPPSLLAAMVGFAPDDEVGTFVRHAFGPFEFAGNELPPATTTFTGRHTVDAGGREVELIEVGPAHTGGDVIAWVPDARVLFAGDILFIDGTPIMWAGPVGNWIAACELIEQLDPQVIVPGHGPLTDIAGARTMAEYFRFVEAGLRARHAAGLGLEDAVRDLDLEINGTRYGAWTDRERLIVTGHGIWAELEPGHVRPDAIGLITAMAADFARR